MQKRTTPQLTEPNLEETVMNSEISEGSGNVFDDLGLSNPRERQAKAQIAVHIANLIESAGWKQVEAAEKMGLKQPDISNIINGRLKGFTLDRLFDCLDSLGQKVEIEISPRAEPKDEQRFLVTY